MASNQPRDSSGEFGEKVTEQDILTAFDAADEPFLTASEVAERLPVSRQAVTHRLKEMAAKGLVGRKEVGARAVGWWAEVAPELSDAARERVESAEGELERGDTVSQAEMKERFGMDG